MSFFGYLAGGLADGAGKALVGEADYADRLGAQRLLAAEKAQDALNLQRERALDRQDQARLMAELKADGAGSGGKVGKGGMNLFQMAMDTPPEKQGALIEAVRGFQGDEAANVMARIFGKGDMAAVSPTPGDFARFDRTVDESGQSATAAPATTMQRVSVDAEKGRVGLQRLLALVADPGKYDDFAKGEARTVGTDAVRGAVATGKDADLRRAGAVNMALEGKDRFGVQGDNVVDKAGVEGAKPTDLGKAKANDENASAGEHSAKAGKARAETDGTGGKGNTAEAKLKIAQARERRLDIKDQIATTIKEREQGLIDKPTAVARLADLKSKQLKYDAIIDGDAEPEGAKPEAKPAAAPKAAPAPAPSEAAPRVITSEAQYRALKSGTRFKAPDGTTRVKP